MFSQRHYTHPYLSAPSSSPPKKKKKKSRPNGDSFKTVSDFFVTVRACALRPAKGASPFGDKSLLHEHLLGDPKRGLQEQGKLGTLELSIPGGSAADGVSVVLLVLLSARPSLRESRFSRLLPCGSAAPGRWDYDASLLRDAIRHDGAADMFVRHGKEAAANIGKGQKASNTVAFVYRMS